MEMKILEEKENNVFKRKEIKFEIHFEKSPSKEEVSEIVSKKFSSPKESVVIDQIKGKFGSSAFLISAKAYHSVQDKEKTEPKPKKEKKAEAPKQE